MATQETFLSPRLTGKRFEDHAIPLELLEDFTAFEELLVELAKWLYFKDHPGRQRVPRGFTKGISLKLAAIEEGSSVPKIILVTSTLTGLFPSTSQDYLMRAKENILKSIDAASNNANITDYIPENLLVYFNRIGKRLKDDESIEFGPGSGLHTQLTKRNRKKLVLFSSLNKQVVNETSVRGTIAEWDKSKNTFTILTEDGRRILADIDAPHYETVDQAFRQYEKKGKVLVNGLGRFNAQDQLDRFEYIEHISLLDPLDVPSRLDELRQLQAGWLDGQGEALSAEGLQWFEDQFEELFDAHLPLPYLFPTAEGDLQAEWSTPQFEITLRIHLSQRSAFYHALDLTTDEEEEAVIDLSQPDWTSLNTKLTRLLKQSEQ